MIPDTYEGFKTLIQLEEMYKMDYYKSLIKFRKDILRDIDNRNQGVVSRDLKLSQPKLSTISNMLKAIEIYFEDCIKEASDDKSTTAAA